MQNHETEKSDRAREQRQTCYSYQSTWLINLHKLQILRVTDGGGMRFFALFVRNEWYLWRKTKFWCKCCLTTPYWNHIMLYINVYKWRHQQCDGFLFGQKRCCARSDRMLTHFGTFEGSYCVGFLVEWLVRETSIKSGHGASRHSSVLIECGQLWCAFLAEVVDSSVAAVELHVSLHLCISEKDRHIQNSQYSDIVESTVIATPTRRARAPSGGRFHGYTRERMRAITWCIVPTVCRRRRRLLRQTVVETSSHSRESLEYFCVWLDVRVSIHFTSRLNNMKILP